MPSEQATAAAEKIRKHEGWEDDADVSEIAAIIDAAFAPVVSLLRECRHLLWHHHIGEGCQERVDALIGKE